MREKLEALLGKVKKAFDNSDIKKTAETLGKQWSYSLIDATTLQPAKPLIVGFNWGAAEWGNARYKPQTMVEAKSFGSSDAGAMARLGKPLATHTQDAEFIDHVSTANMCFFRSPRAEDITQADLARCEPLWEELVEILKPSLILVFAAPLRDRLLREALLKDIRRLPVRYLRRGSDVTYAAIHASFRGVPLLSLPHPNFQMPGDKREEAWAQAFASLRQSHG